MEEKGEQFKSNHLKISFLRQALWGVSLGPDTAKHSTLLIAACTCEMCKRLEFKDHLMFKCSKCSSPRIDVR